MQYPQYIDLKNTKIHWIPKQPSNWDIKRLRFVLKVNPVKSAASKLDEDTMVSFVPMESVGENGGMDVGLARPISEVYSGYTYFTEGDTVVAKITPCFENGKGAISRNLENGIGFGTTEFHVLKAGDGVDESFQFYLTISHPFRDIGASEMFGAGGQKRIPEDFIKDFRIGIPPLDEQQKIARFLDYKTRQIDQLIEKKKALIEKLDEQRIAVITQAVTKGVNGKAKMKPSGVEWLGDIPEHWKVEKLKYSIHMKGGGTPNTSTHEYWNGDIPWVSPKDMKSDLVSNTEDYITELGLKNSSTTLVDEGELLMVVRSGILRHSIPVSIAGKQVSLNQDMKALITDKNKLSPHFLKEIIWSNQKSLLPFWSKPGCTVESIETEYMANTKIALPPINEQVEILEKIKDSVAPIDKMVKLATKSIELYTIYRSALITSAVTGKIDVRNIRIPKGE
ncbi:MAG: restriction endonuclease subunit S [Candidatus Thiodiazotropha lotti]